MSGISPAKRNLVIHERDETAIGDRHAVCVGAEVAKHLLGSAESWFAIDHPARNKKLTDKTPKQSGLRQPSEEAMELELSGCISLLERGDEFPTEELAESPYREEKLVVPGACDPGTSRRRPRRSEHGDGAVTSDSRCEGR